MISVEEALAQVLRLAQPLPTETLPLRQTLGRRLAAPVTARMSQPPFDASAMDGYAVAGEATPGAKFTVIGEAAAGHGSDRSLVGGQALRIFTGAPVPKGANRVVIQENVERAGNIITIGPHPDSARHIRPRGQDFAAGTRFLPKILTPADLGLLAAMNIAEVPVPRRPVVAFVSTGDELVMPGERPGPDQIIASSAIALAALAETAGATSRILPIARDDLASLRVVLDLARGADVIVTLGGASVGDHDLIGRQAQELGLELDFWKIALRPGKPVMAGTFNGVPFLGLPGNPVSAYVCALLLLLPMLRAMQGDPAPEPLVRTALSGTDLAANGARRHFMRANFDDQSGQITAHRTQDSALTSVLAQSNALLIRPECDPARATLERVPYLPLP